ncbi:MAG: YafY family transcriptional regulator [Anaerolineae bacterium]|nr:YafY family transcriptional regulator [Anaerolineae bacterium]
MSNVATRLLSLIMLLQTRPTWKAADLAAELSVSERTIHRYMSMLDEMGIPIYSERGPYGGFSLLRGYKLPPLIFSAEEATVLYMGANLVREVWGRTYDDAVTSVTAKLDNVLPDELRRQVALARQSLIVEEITARDYRPWESALHVLRQCVIDRRCARVTYRAPGRDEANARVIEPYALSFRWGLWYLVGYCRLRQEMRTFRVDRIQEAAPLDERFEMPASFDVRDHLDHTLWSEPNYRVVVRLYPAVTTKARDLYGHWMEIEEQPGGGAIARFGVHNLDWTTGWVLGLGAGAQVISPPELSARVREAAHGALRHYEEPEADVENGAFGDQGMAEL